MCRSGGKSQNLRADNGKRRGSNPTRWHWAPSKCCILTAALTEILLEYGYLFQTSPRLVPINMLRAASLLSSKMHHLILCRQHVNLHQYESLWLSTHSGKDSRRAEQVRPDECDYIDRASRMIMRPG